MSDAFFLTWLCFWALAYVRNELAARWQFRAIEEASTLAKQAIRHGDPDWGRFYDQLPSQWFSVIDLTQWRYRSPFAGERDE